MNLQAENNITIAIADSNNMILSEKTGADEVNLVYDGAYKEGDKIIVKIPEKNTFYNIKLDDAVERSLLFVTDNITYTIPFGEKRINISPKAYAGNRHVLNVRKAYDFELQQYRNLALNTFDFHGNTSCYPHASANVETRGESVFAALNAIDGCTVSHSHGEWPFQSWGINQNPDAIFKLEFGRSIVTDKIILYTRADYPHDNWWKNITISFSDGSSIISNLIKTGNAQIISFEKRKIEWLTLSKLIKSDDPSPFPALTQIEVYGQSLV